MLVDSRGSRKPLDRPIATTFLFQKALRRPVLNLSTRGSPTFGVGRFSSSVEVASSSLMNLLE
jgi:hypothetical protein